MKEVINPLTWRFDLVGDGWTPGPAISYTAWDWIDITNYEISIDPTVVATQTDLSDKANTSDVNTKTFELSWTGSTATVIAEAQNIYDYYDDWKNPLIIYNNYTYILSNATASRLEFRWKLSIENQNSSSYTRQDELYINFTDDVVTSVEADVASVWWSYLRLWQTYSIPYIPTLDWEPTSKKYVDEHWPSIPVYATHWSITWTKTFTVLEQGTFRIELEWTRWGVTNRNITVSVDWTTVATYTAAYSGLISVTTTVTAAATIWLTFDTDITIYDIVIDKINIQSWYLTES